MAKYYLINIGLYGHKDFALVELNSLNCKEPPNIGDKVSVKGKGRNNNKEGIVVGSGDNKLKLMTLMTNKRSGKRGKRAPVRKHATRSKINDEPTTEENSSDEEDELGNTRTSDEETEQESEESEIPAKRSTRAHKADSKTSTEKKAGTNTKGKEADKKPGKLATRSKNKNDLKTKKNSSDENGELGYVRTSDEETENFSNEFEPPAKLSKPAHKADSKTSTEKKAGTNTKGKEADKPPGKLATRSKNKNDLKTKENSSDEKGELGYARTSDEDTEHESIESEPPAKLSKPAHKADSKTSTEKKAGTNKKGKEADKTPGKLATRSKNKNDLKTKKNSSDEEGELIDNPTSNEETGRRQSASSENIDETSIFRHILSKNGRLPKKTEFLVEEGNLIIDRSQKKSIIKKSKSTTILAVNATKAVYKNVPELINFTVRGSQKKTKQVDGEEEEHKKPLPYVDEIIEFCGDIEEQKGLGATGEWVIVKAINQQIRKDDW